MMCLIGLFSSLSAQTTVDLVIGEDGTTSSPNVPSYEFYKYSISQQIYTAEEMWNMESSTVSSIAFRQDDATVQTRNLSVYLVNTTKTGFAGYTDWLSVSEEDLVFSGNVTYPGVAGGWLNIEFDKPFEYEGGNILVCVCDNTGSWETTTYFDTYNAGTEMRVLYAYTDSGAYDPSNPGVSGNYSMDWSSGNSRNNVVKFNVTVPEDFKALSVAPTTIDLGDRPNGAWMRPANVVVGTIASSLNVNSVESSEPYFQLTPDAELPKKVSTNDVLTVEVKHGEGEGVIEGQFAVAYGAAKDIELVDMVAFAYEPEANDVVETAEVIASYPFSATPNMETTYDNYLLPGDAKDGDDVVYEMNFENDVVLSANVTGANGKVAVYTEDFAGKEGPMADNNYEGPEVGYAPIPAPTKFSYDFEWANTDGWDVIDADGDGYRWQSSYYTLGYPGSFGHNSEFCMTSLSYAYMPLDPDNYMVTEEKYAIFPES